MMDMFFPYRIIFKNRKGPEKPTGGPGEKPMTLDDLRQWVEGGRREERDERKRPGASEELLLPSEKFHPRVEPGVTPPPSPDQGRGPRPAPPESPRKEIDMAKRREMIKRLEAITQEQFYSRVMAVITAKPEDVDQEEYRIAQILLNDLPERMTYVAIVLNWSEKALLEEYEKILYRLLDKVVWGGLFDEARRKTTRLYWTLTEREAEHLRLPGLNDGLERRMNDWVEEDSKVKKKRRRQLIAPSDIPEIAQKLQELKTEYFNKPLKEVKEKHINEKAKETYEELILPQLAFQIIAKAIVENHPIGDSGDPNKNTIRKRKKKKDVPWWPIDKEVEIIEVLTPRQVAIEYIVTLYKYELIKARNATLKSQKERDRIDKEDRERESLKRKTAEWILEKLGILPEK